MAAAASQVVWPPRAKQFTIRPEPHGNGVVPIKKPFVRELARRGWVTEAFPALPTGVLTPGDLDALLTTPEGSIAFEWETGNISSSHRALNKLLLSMLTGGVLGGILAVPSAALRPYLTDRVGNIDELRPYFPLWRSIPIDRGSLQIVVVEHDAESHRVRRIPKGTDGRALR